MNRLIRFYNANKKTFWLIILAIIFVYALIKLFEYTAKNEISFNTQKTSQIVYTPEKSLVSGKNIDESTYKKQSTIIENFINYCNTGKVEEAYDLLSEDCKEVMYNNNLEEFKNTYYSNIFYEEKSYSMQNWVGDTYQIRFSEDMMSAGKFNDGSALEDYYTIVNEKGKEKLNINGFIKKQELNKKITQENIEIEVIDRQIYMDYEIYNFKAKNNTGNTVFLNNFYEPQSLYITDNNNVKHYAYTNEIIESDFLLQNNYSSQFKIKYNNPYVSDREIKKVVFKNVILDYRKDNYMGYNELQISINL